MNPLSLHAAALLAQASTGGPQDRTYLIAGVICLGVALLLFALEFFVPSGGTLGVLSALSLLAGVILLILHDTVTGLIGAIGVLMALPLAFLVGIKFWPHTPIGRLLTLRAVPAHADETTGNPHFPSPSLRGRTGQALTDLHPVGPCLIDGQRVECLAEAGIIPAGSTIEVTAVDGMNIKVRQLDR